MIIKNVFYIKLLYQKCALTQPHQFICKLSIASKLIFSVQNSFFYGFVIAFDFQN